MQFEKCDGKSELWETAIDHRIIIMQHMIINIFIIIAQLLLLWPYFWLWLWLLCNNCNDNAPPPTNRHEKSLGFSHMWEEGSYSNLDTFLTITIDALCFIILIKVIKRSGVGWRSKPKWGQGLLSTNRAKILLPSKRKTEISGFCCSSEKKVKQIKGYCRGPKEE